MLDAVQSPSHGRRSLLKGPEKTEGNYDASRRPTEDMVGVYFGDRPPLVSPRIPTDKVNIALNVNHQRSGCGHGKRTIAWLGRRKVLSSPWLFRTNYGVVHKGRPQKPCFPTPSSFSIFLRMWLTPSPCVRPHLALCTSLWSDVISR